MENEKKTGEDPLSNNTQDEWWSQNRRGLIAYVGVAGAIILPVVGLGIIFSQSTPRVSESPEPMQLPTIELKTQSTMPSMAAAKVLFGS